MAETKDKLITAESLKYVHDSLSEKIVDKSSITLGVHTDGLIYIFVNDLPEILKRAFPKKGMDEA